MDYSIKIQTLLQIEKRKWLFLVGLVGLTHLFCQSLMLPYGNALLSLLPNDRIHGLVKTNDSSFKESIHESFVVANHHNESLLVRGVKSTVDEDVDDDEPMEEEEEEKVQGKLDFALDGDDTDNDFDFVEDETLNRENVVDMENEQIGASERNRSLGRLMDGSSRDSMDGNHNIEVEKTRPLDSDAVKPLLIESVIGKISESNASISGRSDILASSVKNGERPNGDSHLLLHSVSDESKNESKPMRKKMRCEMPPKTVTTIHEMQQLLIQNRARSRSMRPRWSSERDQEILRAKLKIESAPILRNDRELYAPLFRNISTFKRSYELMEQVLKVYVYKEGEKPIFHQPILKGLYASEGWFMKLMEGHKRFVVKDPRKAHLFYMPFSSRMLEYMIYVRNSHNRTNLRQYLKNYSERIAAKYRFWNRTGGADHFLVACHDWAPYETRHHMEHCIKALCNADVTMGFKIGRDISLPETYVRSARNPLRDLGGKPPSQRHILAFYAGNMHGYLRTILLKYWKDKDPDMKILGPMPPGVASKMSYIQYMKSSRYCICPKGYEVNSPRIVESIFYECVPVIISDNFVPPFFEVLNWDAFAVIIAEKDIPNLKNILVSISEQKYLEMQLGVRKAQQHFLWHAKPVKYDLFHMTLHSIWYNRVFQTKAR